MAGLALKPARSAVKKGVSPAAKTSIKKGVQLHHEPTKKAVEGLENAIKRGNELGTAAAIGALVSQSAALTGAINLIDEIAPLPGSDEKTKNQVSDLIKKSVAQAIKDVPIDNPAPLPKPEPEKNRVRPKDEKKTMRRKKPCDCPNQYDSRNRRCGGRCALIKPGGRKPKC